ARTSGRPFVFCGVAKDVANEFLQAAAVLFGALLQAFLYVILDIPNVQLSHTISLRYHDIATEDLQELTPPAPSAGSARRRRSAGRRAGRTAGAASARQ